MQGTDWNKEASNFIKTELARDGIGYKELIQRLAALGIEESYTGIAAKINRGTFSFVFFMQCMKVLGNKIVRFED